VSQHPPFFFLFSALKHTHCSKQWYHMFRTTLLLHAPLLVGKWMLRQTVGAAQPGPSRILFVDSPLDCNAFEFRHMTSQLLPLVLLADVFPGWRISRASRWGGPITATTSTSFSARCQRTSCEISSRTPCRNANAFIPHERSARRFRGHSVGGYIWLKSQRVVLILARTLSAA